MSGVPRGCKAIRGAIALIGALSGSIAAARADPPAQAAPAPVNAPGLADQNGGWASDHVLVKVVAGIGPGVDAQGRPCLRDANGPIAASTQLLATFHASAVQPAGAVTPADAALAAALGLDRWYSIVTPHGSDAPALVAQLRAMAGIVESADLDGVGDLADTVPNDPSFIDQWDFKNTGQVVGGVAGVIDADIRATMAWDITTGGSAIVVGVLDSGVSPHPDLAGRILPGWNIPQNNNATADLCTGHGTHVAGTIGAAGNNATAVAGLCWDAQIMPVVVVNPCGGLESYVADGIVWAVDHGARIINMSLQYSVGSQYFHDKVIYAYSSGVPMCAATGNSGATPPSFPSRWDETIAVAATDNTDHRWPSSNYGPQVDVAAPGVNIVSLAPGSGVATKTGTSMSTPHATGTALLMLTVNPNLTPDQVRSVLMQSADDVETPGFDDYTGAGRINAYAAVLAAQALLPIPGDLNNDGQVNGADLGLLLGGWGPCGDCQSCVGDLNGDCVVNGADLGILIGHWSAS